MVSVRDTEETAADTSSLSRLRWTAVGVFMFASMLNYLDRQLLAALAPTLMSEFQMTNAQYGQLIAVFSLVYALSTPLAGLLIDRIGVRLGALIAVAVWSAAGAATGLVQTFRGLLLCRVALAIGESAGIPAATKTTANALPSRELGVGTALQSVGTSVGSIAAPLLVAAMVPAFGWQSVFLVAGVLGFAWLPVWMIASKRMPSRAPAGRPPVLVASLLRDPQFWSIAAANALVMALFSLWMNWTTVFFVTEHQMTMTEANQRLAWIPPVFATLGGFAGGGLALYLIKRGEDGMLARRRICTRVAPVLLLTATIPFISSPGMAAAMIAFTFFACLVVLNNLQMIPIDLYGPERAAFTGSVLTCSFALMQMVVSPLIGSLVDAHGFTLVCIGMSVLPIIGVIVLHVSTSPSRYVTVPA